jgi:hypothetical protein
MVCLTIRRNCNFLIEFESKGIEKVILQRINGLGWFIEEMRFTKRTPSEAFHFQRQSTAKRKSEGTRASHGVGGMWRRQKWGGLNTNSYVHFKFKYQFPGSQGEMALNGFHFRTGSLSRIK